MLPPIAEGAPRRHDVGRGIAVAGLAPRPPKSCRMPLAPISTALISPEQPEGLGCRRATSCRSAPRRRNWQQWDALTRWCKEFFTAGLATPDDQFLRPAHHAAGKHDAGALSGTAAPCSAARRRRTSSWRDADRVAGGDRQWRALDPLNPTTRHRPRVRSGPAVPARL